MIRRAFLQAVAAMTGLGSSTPSRFPYPGRPQPGQGVAPGQSQITRARYVIIYGQNGGLFVYVNPPKKGNPPIIWITTATKDPYGNVLPFSGMGLTNGSATTHVDAASIQLGFAGANTFSQIDDNGDGVLSFISSTKTNTDTAAAMELFSAQASPTARPLALLLSGSTGGVFVDLPNSAVHAAEPGTNTIETWHPLTLINGWTSTISPSYTLFPDRTVMVAGVLSSAGAAGNPIFANVPAAYRPATQQETSAGLHGAPPAGGAFLRIATGGDLSILGSTAATGPWSVNWRYSLDYA